MLFLLTSFLLLLDTSMPEVEPDHTIKSTKLNKRGTTNAQLPQPFNEIFLIYKSVYLQGEHSLEFNK